MRREAQASLREAACRPSQFGEHEPADQKRGAGVSSKCRKLDAARRRDRQHAVMPATAAVGDVEVLGRSEAVLVLVRRVIRLGQFSVGLLLRRSQNRDFVLAMK